MVKRVFLVIVLSLNVLLGFSQKSNFGGGLFFGNTFSSMSADNIPGYWKAGITTGLFGHIKVVLPSCRPYRGYGGNRSDHESALWG